MTAAHRPEHDGPTALPNPAAKRLRELGRRVCFASGEELIQQHAGEDLVLLIERGLAVVAHENAAGKCTVLALRRKGELVGELAALNHTPRSATVRASTAIDAVAVPAARFRALMRSEPEVAFHVLQQLAARVSESDRRRIDTGTAPVPARLARLLLELADWHGRPAAGGGVEIRGLFTQEQLGGAIGATRESVGRALATLRTQKVVTTGRNAVTVLRMDQLFEYARQLF